MRVMNVTDPAVPDHLARSLLPVLLHKLANATQLLTGMNAMLNLEGGEQLFAERSGDLARCSSNVVELGWALAVVASGNGAELLLARRDPRGLRIVLELVADASRRGEGARLNLGEDLPHLTPATLDGWQLPWAIASLLLAACQDGDGGSLDWRLTQEGEPWCLTVAGESGLRARAEQVIDQLPGAEWSWDDGQGRLRIPAGWLLAV